MKTVNEIKQEIELVEIVKSALDINGQVARQLIKKWTQDDSIKYASGRLLKSNLDNYVTLTQRETVLSKDDTAKLLEVTDKIISSLNSMKKIPNLNLDEIVSNNEKGNKTFSLGNPVGKELIIHPSGEVTVVDETEAETQLRELPSGTRILTNQETKEYFKSIKESKFKVGDDFMNLKELALILIKNINSNATSSSEVVTKLKLVNGEKSTTVTDFSYFANESYMTKELIESLKSGRTLTDDESEELESFILESIIEIN